MSHHLPKLDPDALPLPADLSGDAEALARVDAVIAGGPFDATWESLSNYETPLWFRDAKFGIFIHWGVYSVPAFESEWYSRTMYLEGTTAYDHHVATYGPHREFGYKDFIPSFTMEKFEPDAWAALFRRSGAQYVMPVAEHHDGFAMYDTKRSRWNAAQMGPQRDVMGDLLASVDKASMVRAASSHRIEHWFFMNGGSRFDSDVRDLDYADLYGPAQREETAPHESFLEDWLLRTVEIIDEYRPQVLWFDWWLEHPAAESYVKKLAAYYYNRAAEWGRSVVINYKWQAFRPGSAVYDIERGAMAGIRPDAWQNDTAVSRSSWCWTEGHRYKSVAALIAELVDVVSKNGNMLLNIGPKPDGTIPEAEQRILEQIGDWLTRNGEAIYGSRPWTVYGEGPTQIPIGSMIDDAEITFTAEDMRFTTRHDVTGDYVYAILLAPAEDGVARIRALGSSSVLLSQDIAEVSVLGATGEEVEWVRNPESLDVVLPDAARTELGAVVKLYLAATPPEVRKDFLHG